MVDRDAAQHHDAATTEPVTLSNVNVSEALPRTSVDTNPTIVELDTKPGFISEFDPTEHVATADEACTNDVWPFCDVVGVVVEQPGDGSLDYWLSDHCVWFDQTLEFQSQSADCHVIGVQWLCVDVEPYWSSLFVVLRGLPER